MSASARVGARDQRRAVRHPCKVPAQARLIGRWAPCTIVDRSELGCRLRLDKPATLDPAFLLRDLATGEVRPVRVVWAEKLAVGVAYITTPQVRPTSPDFKRG